MKLLRHVLIIYMHLVPVKLPSLAYQQSFLPSTICHCRRTEGSSLLAGKNLQIAVSVLVLDFKFCLSLICFRFVRDNTGWL